MDVFGGGAHVGDVGGDDEDRERKRDAEMEQNRASGFFRRRSRSGWTMAIMTSVDVSGPTQKRIPSGCARRSVHERGIFAMMYALLEESRAKCHWEEAYRAKSMRTEACIRANPEGKCAPATIGWKRVAGCATAKVT